MAKESVAKSVVEARKNVLKAVTGSQESEIVDGSQHRTCFDAEVATLIVRRGNRLCSFVYEAFGHGSRNVECHLPLIAAF